MNRNNSNPRVEAFWFDAAGIAVANLDQAVASQDVAKQRHFFRDLVSVSCQYPATSDPRLAEMYEQIEQRLQASGAAAVQLRTAFRHWPHDPAWTSGAYAALAERAVQLPAEVPPS